MKKSYTDDISNFKIFTECNVKKTYRDQICPGTPKVEVRF